MKKTLLLFLLAGMISSCEKNETSPGQPSGTTRDGESEPREHEEGTETVLYTTYHGESNSVPIPTSGVSVENGYLVFDQMETFNSVMDLIVNRDRNEIYSWTQNMGYTSLYDVNQAYVDDPATESFEFNENRIPDRYFETILNADGKIKIGTDLYVYNFAGGFLTVFHENGSTTTHTLSFENLEGKMPIEQTRKRFGVPITYGSAFGHPNFRLSGNKFWADFVIYASLGANLTHSEVSNGRWKPKKRHYLKILVDQWHTISWSKNNGADQTRTNRRWETNTLQSDMCLVLDWGPGTFSAVNYPRIHMYSEIIDRDLHIDQGF
jgi:hypothetical protein